jgi:hypothetical protein
MSKIESQGAPYRSCDNVTIVTVVDRANSSFEGRSLAGFRSAQDRNLSLNLTPARPRPTGERFRSSLRPQVCGKVRGGPETGEMTPRSTSRAVAGASAGHSTMKCNALRDCAVQDMPCVHTRLVRAFFTIHVLLWPNTHYNGWDTCHNCNAAEERGGVLVPSRAQQQRCHRRGRRWGSCSARLCSRWRRAMLRIRVDH